MKEISDYFVSISLPLKWTQRHPNFNHKTLSGSSERTEEPIFYVWAY